MDAIKEVKKNCIECIVMPDPGPKKNIKKVVEEVHPLVLATDMGELSKEYMAIARSLNVKVITDDKKGNLEEWKKILKMGVDGIQTDDPEKLIQYLKEIN